MEEVVELVKTRNNEKLRGMLKDDPSLATVSTSQGISLLLFAAYCRNQEAVDLIKGLRNEFSIYEAATIGDTRTIQVQLEQNPSLLNSFAHDGFTILGLACFFGQAEVVRFLLTKNADPNIPSNNDFQVTPLHSACAISNIEIAELLIRAGANVNAKQRNGYTPLHSASHNGQTQLAKLLLENGADANAKSEDGQTPLSMAQEKNFNETIDVLIEFGGA